MKKIIWLIISTLTALSAAFFLYDGQKLLFSCMTDAKGSFFSFPDAVFFPFMGTVSVMPFRKMKKP